MAGFFDPRTALLVGAAVAGLGFTFSPSGTNPRVQERLYSHLSSAERALSTGNESEALAYAEMILLRREITVYVDDKNVPWQIKENAAKAVRTAAANWEDTLGQEVRFRFVPFRDADVTVTYADGMRYDGKDAAGTVRWTRQVMNLGSGQYRYEVRANITLRTHTPRGDMMNYSQMLHTAGHELGHILGLEDTARAGELMGPLRLDRPVERATRSERDGLLELRKLAGDILARITGTQSEEEEEVPRILILVVSDPAVLVEDKEPSVRNARDQRRAHPVRSTVRDRQAQARKTSFAITGMAR